MMCTNPPPTSRLDGDWCEYKLVRIHRKHFFYLVINSLSNVGQEIIQANVLSLLYFYERTVSSYELIFSIVDKTRNIS